jgi:hypothetical protein
MRRLVEPNKGDDVKADLIREIIGAIRENMPVAGEGLKATQTLNGTILSLAKLASRGQTGEEVPRAFDLRQGSDGKLKLVRCYYQIGSSFYTSATEPEFVPAAGSVCVIINTSTGDITAAINSVFNPGTPELMPVRLYIIDSTGGILCDLRGSQVVVYA